MRIMQPVTFQKEEINSSAPNQNSKKQISAPSWHLIPAVLAVCSCVFGLVLCIVWKHKYLSICFGTSTLCSFYILHISCKSKSFKKFEENHKNLYQTVDKLKKTLTDRSSSNLNLKSEISTLTEKNNQLKLYIEKLKNQNSNLTNQQSHLSEKILYLENAKKELLKEVDSFINRNQQEQKTLQQLNQLLISVKESFDGNENYKNQAILNELFNSLSEISKKSESINITVVLLHKTFDSLNNWNNSELIVENLEKLQVLTDAQQKILEEVFELEARMVILCNFFKVQLNTGDNFNNEKNKSLEALQAIQIKLKDESQNLVQLLPSK